MTQYSTECEQCGRTVARSTSPDSRWLRIRCRDCGTICRVRTDLTTEANKR